MTRHGELSVRLAPSLELGLGLLHVAVHGLEESQAAGLNSLSGLVLLLALLLVLLVEALHKGLEV
eukprot:CAMPEP_0171233652 /NCGR_PEP_ID=MMETSP0790-20130122/41030_1 /TAXON_ID=2925 /ORGANISM="Alexandrium catenella, Strain OF101" /LENGTH=64 /DNA_ID=CAMNT_0011699917 /DNA_START=28 /DNA_END=222 /DNA_ORIENTATION=+